MLSTFLVDLIIKDFDLNMLFRTVGVCYQILLLMKETNQKIFDGIPILSNFDF